LHHRFYYDVRDWGKEAITAEWLCLNAGLMENIHNEPVKDGKVKGHFAFPEWLM